MLTRMRMYIVLALAACLVLAFIYPGAAQRVTLSGVQVLNGDFEGNFYAYDTGEVAEYWVPYDHGSTGGLPQYRRKTEHVRNGSFAQMFWTQGRLFNAGIYQVIGSTGSPALARVIAGRTFTAHVWMYSIYEAAGGTIQDDKILKRVGLDPYGGTNAYSSNIVWTPWQGQDESWVQINCKAEARSSQITLFIEAYNASIGYQDQVYIDAVTIEEEGVAPPTATIAATRTPTPTATPAIQVIQTVNVGDQPKAMAVLPDINRYLVANSGSNTVSKLEGDRGWQHSIFGSEGVGPSNIAVDADHCVAYVVNTGSNSVAKFDNVCGSVSHLVGTLALGEGKRPNGIAVLTTTNTIYVANTQASSVSVIDGATFTFVKDIAVGPVPGQVAVNPRTNKVYVTSPGYQPDNDGTLAVIDGNSQTVIRTITFSGADALTSPQPYGVAVNPVTNKVYVGCFGGKLVVIDGATNNPLGALAPPTSSSLSHVVVNPASNNVFVASAVGDAVFVYDADAGTWGRPLSTGSGGPLGGLVVNPLTSQVLVSNTGQDSVSIVRDFGAYQPLRIFLPISLKAMTR